jgi:hypothetical protein
MPAHASKCSARSCPASLRFSTPPCSAPSLGIRPLRALRRASSRRAEVPWWCTAILSEITEARVGGLPGVFAIDNSAQAGNSPIGLTSGSLRAHVPIGARGGRARASIACGFRRRRDGVPYGPDGLNSRVRP